MRQLQKLVAHTDCGLGQLERDLRTMESQVRALSCLVHFTQFTEPQLLHNV